MKYQINTAGKIFYSLLVIVSIATILNFFSFGFLFAWAFGFVGSMLQAITCFASLLLGSITWAAIETMDEKFTF